MKPIEKFKLELGGDSGVNRLLDVDRGGAIELPGRVLEGQFECALNEYLVVLTDDRPFEETLRLSLIDDQIAIQDSLVIEAPYQSLVIDKIEANSQNAISIHTNENKKFEVIVNPKRVSFWARTFGSMAGKKFGKNGRLMFQIK